MGGQKTITEQKSNQEQQINQQIFHSFLRKHINYNQKITGEDALTMINYYSKKFGLKIDQSKINFKEDEKYKLGEVIEKINKASNEALSKAFVKISEIPKENKYIRIKKVGGKLFPQVFKKVKSDGSEKEIITDIYLKENENKGSNNIIGNTVANYAQKYLKGSEEKKIKKKRLEEMFVEALNPGAGIRIEYYRNGFSRFMSKIIPKRKHTLKDIYTYTGVHWGADFKQGGESVYRMDYSREIENNQIGIEMTVDGKTTVSPIYKRGNLKFTADGVYLGNNALSLNIDQGVGLSIGHGLIYYGSKGFEIINPLFLGINVMINSVSEYAKQEINELERKSKKINKTWVYTKAFFKALRPDNLVKNTGKMVLSSVKEGAKWVTNYWHKMFRKKEPERGYNYDLDTSEGLDKFRRKYDSVIEDFRFGRVYSARYKAKKLLKTMENKQLTNNITYGFLEFIVDYVDNPEKISNKAEKILENGAEKNKDIGYLLAYELIGKKTIYYNKLHNGKIRNVLDKKMFPNGQKKSNYIIYEPVEVKDFILNYYSKSIINNIGYSQTAITTFNKKIEEFEEKLINNKKTSKEELKKISGDLVVIGLIVDKANIDILNKMKKALKKDNVEKLKKLGKQYLMIIEREREKWLETRLTKKIEEFEDKIENGTNKEELKKISREIDNIIQELENTLDKMKKLGGISKEKEEYINELINGGRKLVDKNQNNKKH